MAEPGEAAIVAAGGSWEAAPQPHHVFLDQDPLTGDMFVGSSVTHQLVPLAPGGWQLAFDGDDGPVLLDSAEGEPIVRLVTDILDRHLVQRGDVPESRELAVRSSDGRIDLFKAWSARRSLHSVAVQLPRKMCR